MLFRGGRRGAEPWLGVGVCIWAGGDGVHDDFISSDNCILRWQKVVQFEAMVE